MSDILNEWLKAYAVRNHVAWICRMNIGGDGIYYFKTELAGDESKVGWGSDPEPHIHYDLICRQVLRVPFKFEYLQSIQTCQSKAYSWHGVVKEVLCTWPVCPLAPFISLTATHYPLCRVHEHVLVSGHLYTIQPL